MLTCAEVMWITVHSRDCSLNRFHRPATNDCGQQQEGALPAIPERTFKRPLGFFDLLSMIRWEARFKLAKCYMRASIAISNLECASPNPCWSGRRTSSVEVPFCGHRGYAVGDGRLATNMRLDRTAATSETQSAFHCQFATLIAIILESRQGTCRSPVINERRGCHRQAFHFASFFWTRAYPRLFTQTCVRSFDYLWRSS